MKNKIIVFVGAALLALVFVSKTSAIPITGSISFHGSPEAGDAPIGAANQVADYDWIAIAQQAGTFAPVANVTSLTFSPFIFSPPTQAIAPLWSFHSLGKTYSFSTTSLTAMFNQSLNIWNFGGKGILSATGFEDTIGDWNFSIGQIGQSFYFDSKVTALATTTMPDSGMTVVLLGLGLCLIAIARTSRVISS